MRQVILYIEDHELAEIAALGIGLSAGWNTKIVHDLKGLDEVLRSGAAYAILRVDLRSDHDVCLEITDLLQIAKAHSTPVVVLTTEQHIFERLRNFDVLPVRSEFDPLLLSSLINTAVSTRPQRKSATFAWTK